MDRTLLCCCEEDDPGVIQADDCCAVDVNVSTQKPFGGVWRYAGVNISGMNTVPPENRSFPCTQDADCDGACERYTGQWVLGPEQKIGPCEWQMDVSPWFDGRCRATPPPPSDRDCPLDGLWSFEPCDAQPFDPTYLYPSLCMPLEGWDSVSCANFQRMCLRVQLQIITYYQGPETNYERVDLGPGKWGAYLRCWFEFLPGGGPIVSGDVGSEFRLLAGSPLALPVGGEGWDVGECPGSVSFVEVRPQHFGPSAGATPNAVCSWSHIHGLTPDWDKLYPEFSKNYTIQVFVFNSVPGFGPGTQPRDNP